MTNVENKANSNGTNITNLQNSVKSLQTAINSNATYFTKDDLAGWASYFLLHRLGIQTANHASSLKLFSDICEAHRLIWTEKVNPNIGYVFLRVNAHTSWGSDVDRAWHTLAIGGGGDGEYHDSSGGTHKFSSNVTKAAKGNWASSSNGDPRAGFTGKVAGWLLFNDNFGSKSLSSSGTVLRIVFIYT